MEDKDIEFCFFEDVTQKAHKIYNDKTFLNSKSERWRFTPISECINLELWENIFNEKL